MKNYFTRTRFENDKYFVEKVEETSFDVETLPTQEVKVTHIGAYGQIKFNYEGLDYETAHGQIAKRCDSDCIFVNTENLVFDKNPKELMTFIYTTRQNHEYWVEVPTDWKRCPEGWIEIPETAHEIEVGATILNYNNDELIVDSIYHFGCITATNGFRYYLTSLRGYKKK